MRDFRNYFVPSFVMVCCVMFTINRQRERQRQRDLDRELDRIADEWYKGKGSNYK